MQERSNTSKYVIAKSVHKPVNWFSQSLSSNSYHEKTYSAFFTDKF